MKTILKSTALIVGSALILSSCGDKSEETTKSETSTKSETPSEVSQETVEAVAQDLSKTVTIGSQVWATENLNVDKFRNGDPILEIKEGVDWIQAGKDGTPAWCYYGNLEENGSIHGKLYNWHAVNDPRGLAPEGYHIPTNDEFYALKDALVTNQGNKIKSKEQWNIIDGIENTNESGFSALPSGSRTSIYFGMDQGRSAYFWTSQALPSNPEKAYYFSVSDFYSEMTIEAADDKKNGYSVRCIKD